MRGRRSRREVLEVLSGGNVTTPDEAQNILKNYWRGFLDLSLVQFLEFSKIAEKHGSRGKVGKTK